MLIQERKAFTLIELLVVISIISLLASVVLSSLNSARASGRDAQRKADMTSLRNAIELYHLENRQYPANPSNTRVINMNSGQADITPYISPIPVDPVFSGQDNQNYRYRTNDDRTGYTLMAQLETDSHNSWCKIVMGPGDDTWSTNSSYALFTSSVCS